MSTGFLVFLSVGGFLFFACLLGIAFADFCAFCRREKLVEQVERWRRERPRGRLIQCTLGGAEFGVMPTPGVVPMTRDPLTGERVLFGWSESELREVAARPSEFVE